MILARILKPSDFGVFAIVTALTSLFLPVIDSGLTQIIVKLPVYTRNLGDIFHTINLMVGFVVLFIIVVLGFIASKYYGEPNLFVLTAINGFSVFLLAISNIRFATLIRNKRFVPIFIADVSGSIIGVFVAIWFSLNGFGVFSLVIQQLANYIVRYLVFRTSLEDVYSIKHYSLLLQATNHIKSGSLVLLSRLIGGFTFSLDRLMVGHFFNIDTLGYYSTAIRVAVLPDAVIRTPLTNVVLAHTARKPKTERQKDYVTTSNIIFLVSAIPCILLVIAGDIIVPIIMGQQWIESGVYLQILGIMAFGKIFHGLSAIIHFSEMEIKRWVKGCTITVFFIISVPLIYINIYPNPILFTICFSLIYFIVWFTYYCRTLFCFTGRNSEPLLKLIRMVLCTVLGGLGISWVARALIEPLILSKLSSIFYVMVLLFVIMSGALFVNLIFNREQIRSLLAKVR